MKEYENLTYIPKTYLYSMNNEVCGYKNYSYLEEFFNRKEYNIYINNMWCELMKYVVEIDNSYENLFQNNLIKKSKKNEKRKQIFETYYEIFKKIKLKKEIREKVDNYLENINSFISIQIRKGSCDFPDYRNFLDEEDINKFLIEANNLSVKYNINKWFIASDCMKIKTHIINLSNGKGIIYVKHKIKRKEEDDVSASIELEILSRGNYFILTNQSSYGIVSLFKSGRCIDLEKNKDCVKMIGKGNIEHAIQFSNE